MLADMPAVFCLVLAQDLHMWPKLASNLCFASSPAWYGNCSCGAPQMASQLLIMVPRRLVSPTPLPVCVFFLHPKHTFHSHTQKTSRNTRWLQLSWLSPVKRELDRSVQLYHGVLEGLQTLPGAPAKDPCKPADTQTAVSMHALPSALGRTQVPTHQSITISHLQTVTGPQSSLPLPWGD